MIYQKTDFCYYVFKLMKQNVNLKPSQTYTDVSI